MTVQTVSTYLAYKQDTNAFLAWLEKAARARGWKPAKSTKLSEAKPPPIEATAAPSKTQRLKGKARKEANAAKAAQAQELPERPAPAPTLKRVFTTKQVSQQIELVGQVSSGPSFMPPGVSRSLNRAIKARERLARWYKNTKESDASADESHDHFIDVLKRALDLCQGQYQFRPAPFTSDALSAGPDEEKKKYLTNMFAALELEDPAEQSLDEPNEQMESGQANVNVAPVEYDVGDDHASEVHLAMFSVFEDVHRIRAELQQLWHRLVDGKTTLAAATLTVAAALELVRQAEDEAVRVCASDYSDAQTMATEGAYRVFIGALYNSEALGRERGPDINVQEERLAITPFHEFLLLPLANTLMMFEQHGEEEALDATRRTTRPQDPLDVIPPFPPLRMYYRDHVELLEKHLLPKFESEDRFLIHMYQEFRFMEAVKDGKLDMLFPSDSPRMIPGKDMVLPFLDIFHDALRPIWTMRGLSVTSVFAARIMVDMFNICGLSLKGTEVQRQVTGDYRKMFNFDINSLIDSQPGQIPGLAPSAAKGFPSRHKEIQMRSGIDLTEHALWILVRAQWYQVSHAFRGKLLESFRQKPKDRLKYVPEGYQFPVENDAADPWLDCLVGILPQESPVFMMDRNLLYGGTAILDLMSLGEVVGLDLANTSLSILCVAHLYNAARQLGILHETWPELERVIELHVAAIFANDVPTTPKSMFNRFKHRAGLTGPSSQRVASSTARTFTDMTLMNNKPFSFRPTQLTHILREYFDGKITLPRLVYQLQEQAARHHDAFSGGQQQHQETNQNSTSNGKSSTTRNGTGAQQFQRQVSQRQNLQSIEAYINAVLPDLQIDYVSLTRTCDNLIASIREDVAAATDVAYILKPSPQEARNAAGRVETVIFILKDIFGCSLACEELEKRAKKNAKSGGENGVDVPDELRFGPQMKCAAEVLRRHLSAATGV